MRSPPVALLALLVARAATAAGGDAPATEPPVAMSYEALAEAGVRTRDVATLLAPFVERCDGERRDVERARCRATQAFLRRTLPQGTLVTAGDDQAVIAVSGYDAAAR